jgi:hypothetical protein
MERLREDWDRTDVTSTFYLSLQDCPSLDTCHPVKADAGVQYTVICDFGRRFTTQILTQTASNFLTKMAEQEMFTISSDEDEDGIEELVTTRGQVNGNSTSEAHKDDAKPAPLIAEGMED